VIRENREVVQYMLHENNRYNGIDRNKVVVIKLDFFFKITLFPKYRVSVSKATLKDSLLT
jgi:hypothetical protein